MDVLVDRNRHFAATGFRADLTMRASLDTIVISCFDPRVDPAVVLGAEQGEIGVLRNIGGRVTPRTIEELLLLRQVAHAAGAGIGAGWQVVVLHHTNCGITLIQDQTDLLTSYFQTDPGTASIGDPRAAVARDVTVLRNDTRLPGITVSGLVYDVTTGLVETVVKP